MFKLFGKGRFLEADVEDWVLETWAWLLRELGGMERMRRSRIILPTKDFFPPTLTEDHDRAVYLFERTKALAGLADWPCVLEVFDRPDRHQRVAEFAAIRHGSRANGTFQVRDGEVVISYASDLVAQPTRLIATMAHELAHFVLATLKSDVPGGRELAELATDLAVAYLGFGVFSANTAFEFGQHQDAFSQGWASSRNGYLSERTWAFAIALFCALTEAPLPLDHLKKGPANLTRAAARYLSKNDALLAPLRAIA